MSSIESPWTFSTSYLEMYFNEHKLASGSGFFWANAGRMFLVSNWHNFSGLNPENNHCMSPRGARPNKVRFAMYRKLSRANCEGYFELKHEFVERELYNQDEEKALWLEHPNLGQRVDIAALDVTGADSDYLCLSCNDIERDAVLKPFVSQDVFIVGFPLGLIPGNPTPVWKRGTIATEPTYDTNGLPRFFVDSATRQGMSGSVVVARHIIVGNPLLKKDGAETEPFLYATADVVVGIYSGRLGAHEIEAQLGVVWKRNVIDETVMNGVAPKI